MNNNGVDSGTIALTADRNNERKAKSAAISGVQIGKRLRLIGRQAIQPHGALFTQ